MHLILGGARSGKSRRALSLAQAHSGPVSWIATARADDDEMRDRIVHHQAERPPHWSTVESPLHLADALRRCSNRMIVVDCLTLWVANWLCEQPDGWPAARSDFLDALSQSKAEVVLVSNETGLGIVPDNALARQFRDEAGRLHQDLAAMVDEVVFMVAGLPMIVKASSSEQKTQ
ncbi:bifunctional adenosylcobinamide kinase/adenosylcobinamide-phosphate guanylyltransferase [Burkholderiaceae bacterium DAT-1]|nr:bifunctional adenosylcobinamide kinase/adenosylcobinamide-phosphate guanylyltransferase [Burkholderiaceae bacterium DAT-1]